MLYQLSYTHHAPAASGHLRDADADTIVPGQRECPGPVIAHSGAGGSGRLGVGSLSASPGCSNRLAIDRAVAESGPGGGTNTACR